MGVAVTRFAVEPPSVRRCYHLEELLSFLFLDFVLLTSLIHFSFIRTSTVEQPPRYHLIDIFINHNIK
jgi:hypothetical protein